MHPAIKEKLKTFSLRYDLLASLLSDAKVIQDQNRFRDLSKEYAQLEPIVSDFKAIEALQTQEISHTALLAEADPELKLLIEEELALAAQQHAALEKHLQVLLLPHDPDDDRDVFLEIRAGTGGHEAAIFAGDLFRMYSRYAERMGWSVEILSLHEGEQGGYKEIIMRISGQRVYSSLKFESGAHRVQRVPETEAQGRIHTSACTVVVLPELDEVGAVDINPADLRIDTFRASGAGGQHVNKTDSAIRITHMPSGMVIECQDERSQHKNRSRAMSLLRSRLVEKARSEQKNAQAVTRKSLAGTGDRSERIRTYNFPQGRVTDHRIQLTLYKLEYILEGDMDALLEPLQQALQTELLARMADDPA